MNEKNAIPTIEILGKPYPVKCHESELPGLEAAAALVNQKMAEIQRSGKAITLERMAVMISLNMAHELLALQQDKNQVTTRLNERINRMQNKLDETMTKTQQVELVYIGE